MKKLLLAAVTLAFTQAHAAESLLERINNHGTVTVGTEGTYAPFTSHDKDGKLTGFDVVFMVLSLFKIKGMGFQTAFQAALAGGSLKAPKFTPQNAASRFR